MFFYKLRPEGLIHGRELTDVLVPDEGRGSLVLDGLRAARLPRHLVLGADCLCVLFFDLSGAVFGQEISNSRCSTHEILNSGFGDFICTWQLYLFSGEKSDQVYWQGALESTVLLFVDILNHRLIIIFTCHSVYIVNLDSWFGPDFWLVDIVT